MHVPGAILVRAEEPVRIRDTGLYQAVFRQTRLNFAGARHLGSDLLLMIRCE